MPADQAAKAATRVWLLLCLEIHQAINTMSFATTHRERLLSSKTPEEINDMITKMPNPRFAAKRRDLVDNGVDSSYVLANFFVLKCLFDDLQAALEVNQWVSGEHYTMADVALLAYIDRLDRIGMAGMWQERTPLVGAWLEVCRARGSY